MGMGAGGSGGEGAPGGSLRQVPFSIIVTLAGCLGCFLSVVGAFLCADGLQKLETELAAVNETVYSNRAQLSLLPLTDDTLEYQQGMDAWAGYFKELQTMSTVALSGPLDEDRTLRTLAGAAPHLFLGLGVLSKSTSGWAVLATAVLFPCAASAGFALVQPLRTMAWINDSLLVILRDLRDVVAKRLLQNSNHNDEYLNLLLFTTGHLQNIDREPPWLAVQLPWPLSLLSVPTARAANHGSAWLQGSVGVTWPVLHALSALGSAALCMALHRLVLELLKN